eukprot:4652319-Alexandrium_andersonii.AAC.1
MCIRDRRAQALELVLGGPPGKLKEFLRKVAVRDRQAAALAAKERMGHAPPCRTYLGLVTVGDMKDRIDGFHVSNTPKDIEQATEDMKPY